MDEKLQQVLAEYLVTMLSAIKEGTALVKDQIPLVVQEKLAFSFVWNAVWVVVGITLIGIGARYWKRAWKHTVDEDVPTILAPIIALIVGIPIFFGSLYSVLQIYFAPRLYIIEWILSLVTKK